VGTNQNPLCVCACACVCVVCVCLVGTIGLFIQQYDKLHTNHSHNMEDSVAVDDQLSADLERISVLEQEKLRKLVNLILTFLLDPVNTDFQSILGAFAEEKLGYVPAVLSV
jgi:hypothetical protein